MKLVFSGNTAWGMYNFRKKVFEDCIQNGHEVYIIAPEDKKYSTLLTNMGCKFFNITISRKGTNPINDFLLYRHYKKLLKQIKPDGCFFYTIKPNIYGGMAAGSLNIPFIPITTGLGYIFTNNNIVSKIAKMLYKLSFSKAKEIWFLNKDDIHSFTEELIIPLEKAKLLKGEGIDTSFFHSTVSEPASFSFILIARLLWDKGVGIYVEAAKQLKKEYPNIQFKLLGAIDTNNPMGIPEETIHDWHKKNIINYLGEVSDVRPYINNSTCVVLPSFYREGIPFCLMEGAASGKPIITTDNIGCREVIIDGYNGFICKPNDVESLIASMKRMINSTPEERIEMGQNGRKFMIKEFDISLIIKEYQTTIATFNL